VTIFVPERLAADKTNSDITSSNVLFRVAENVVKWSDQEFYLNLGQPKMEDIETLGYSPLGPHTYTTRCLSTMHASPFSKTSSSLALDNLPPFSPPQQTTSWRPHPSTYLRKLISKERLDHQLMFWHWPVRTFKSVQDSPSLRPPWEGQMSSLRKLWLHSVSCQSHGGARSRIVTCGSARIGSKSPKPTKKTSVKQKLANIGSKDVLPATGDGPMMEGHGTRLDDAKIELLGDFLEKM